MRQGPRPCSVHLEGRASAYPLPVLAFRGSDIPHESRWRRRTRNLLDATPRVSNERQTNDEDTSPRGRKPGDEGRSTRTHELRSRLTPTEDLGWKLRRAGLLPTLPCEAGSTMTSIQERANWPRWQTKGPAVSPRALVSLRTDATQGMRRSVLSPRGATGLLPGRSGEAGLMVQTVVRPSFAGVHGLNGDLQGEEVVAGRTDSQGASQGEGRGPEPKTAQGAAGRGAEGRDRSHSGRPSTETHAWSVRATECLGGAPRGRGASRPPRSPASRGPAVPPWGVPL